MKRKKRKVSAKPANLKPGRNLYTIRRLQAIASVTTTITVNASVEGGHLRINIKEANKTILSITDNDQKSIELRNSVEYRFEWFVTTSAEAKITIEAEVSPANSGFLPLNIEKKYPAGANDGGVFLFTLN